jgi:sugar (pentulose or hexulose) kinase
LRPSIQQSDGRDAPQVDELAAEVDETAFLARTGNGINQQLIAAKLRWVERNEPAIFAQIRTVFGSYDYINWRLTGRRGIEQNWALEAGFVDLATHELSDDLIALSHLARDAFPPKHASHALFGAVSAEAAAATGLPQGLPVVGGAADHIASALAAGFVSLETHALDPKLTALSGLPASAFPPLVSAHERIGAVTPEAAAATGLPVGAAVFGGAADHIASALAAGLAEAGDVLLKFGGAGDIVVASDVARPDWRLFLDYHLVPGLYAPNGCMAASGSALNWLTGVLNVSGESPHAALDALAGNVAPGSDGVLCLPYFLGEKTPLQDPLARGAYIGLSLGHTPAHLWRATLEAVAYGFRHHVEVLADIGYGPKRFLASDGGTRSRVWMQIMADVLQAPVRLIENAHGSAIGAAFVAGVATGADVAWSDAGRLAKLGATIAPQQANAEVYDRGYRDFRSLYETLKPVFRARAD